MRPSRIDRILSAENTLQPLVAKSRELRDLAGLVHGFLSPDLARQARVANLRDGELILLAANPAAAAKLRLLAPSLSRFIAGQRGQVNSVSVRVQPTESHAVAPQKTANLSANTLDSLKQLHDAMTPSEARAALARLLARQGVRDFPAPPRRRTEGARKPRRTPRT